MKRPIRPGRAREPADDHADLHNPDNQTQQGPKPRGWHSGHEETEPGKNRLNERHPYNTSGHAPYGGAGELDEVRSAFASQTRGQRGRHTVTTLCFGKKSSGDDDRNNELQNPETGPGCRREQPLGYRLELGRDRIERCFEILRGLGPEIGKRFPNNRPGLDICRRGRNDDSVIAQILGESVGAVHYRAR